MHHGSTRISDFSSGGELSLSLFLSVSVVTLKALSVETIRGTASSARAPPRKERERGNKFHPVLSDAWNFYLPSILVVLS